MSLALAITPPLSFAAAPAAISHFDRFATDHARDLRVTALRLCRDTDDAGDLVQDTLERALRHFGAYRPVNGRAWLLTIMHRLFIDRCRRRRTARHVAFEETTHAVEAEQPAEEPAWADASPDQLAAALARLDAPLRDIFTLHAVDRCSYKEIAARLDIPMGTVATRLLRARKRLRALLADQLASTSTH